jgi:AraC-like DNA-binding protein
MRTLYIDAAEIGGLPDITCVVTVSPLLRELVVAAVKIPVEYRDGGRNERVMRLLVDELRVSDILPLHLPIPADARVKSICQALIEHPADISTATQWAEKLGVAAKTVHRLFVQETGMSFSRWREQARLLAALRRIAHGERIIDIAFDCGYASQSAFTAMFRRHFGVPPSAFYR